MKTLYGYINPLGDRPGFLIPIFYDTNHTLIQVINDDDTIADYVKYDNPRGLQLFKDNFQIKKSIGDKALYIFLFDNNDIRVGDKLQLSNLILNRSSEFLHTPFLLLEIGNFTSNYTIYSLAIELTTKQLSSLNADIANHWHDATYQNSKSSNFTHLISNPSYETMSLIKDVSDSDLAEDFMCSMTAVTEVISNSKKIIQNIDEIISNNQIIELTKELDTGIKMLDVEAYNLAMACRLYPIYSSLFPEMSFEGITSFHPFSLEKKNVDNLAEEIRSLVTRASEEANCSLAIRSLFMRVSEEANYSLAIRSLVTRASEEANYSLAMSAYITRKFSSHKEMFHLRIEALNLFYISSLKILNIMTAIVTALENKYLEMDQINPIVAEMKSFSQRKR